MTFLAYTGKPGDGKSYGAVENQILPMLKQGRRIVTNIPLRMERIRESIATGDVIEFPLERVLADPDCITEYVTPGSVFILDEAWKLFPTVKQDKVPIALRSLLAEHRHMVDGEGNSTVLVFIVQDLSMLSTFCRALIHETYFHSKLSALGVNRAYRVDIYSGAVTGQRPPEAKKIRSLNGIFKKSTFALYKSHTMAETDGEGAVEKSGDNRALLWKRPIFYVLPAMVVLLVVFGLPRIMKQFRKEPQQIAAGTSVASPARSASAPSPGQIQVAPKPPQMTWRIVGSMLYENQPNLDVVFLASGGASVTLPLRRFCQTTVEGWLICDYDGRTWSSEIRYRSMSPASAQPIVNQVVVSNAETSF